jgi:surface carbohydrate biosynthesis protein
VTEPATIVITVDNPGRDLPGLVLVAQTLCTRGHRVLLVPVNILLDAWVAEPDFFLINYHRRVNDYQVERILGRGLDYAVMETEGGAVNVKQYLSSLSQNAPLRDRAAAFLMWGDQLAGHVRDAGVYRPEQVKVTGCPRHDYYHASLAESARIRSRRFFDRPDGFVLVIGSHPHGNPRFHTAEQHARMIGEYSGLGYDWSKASQDEQQANMQDLIEATAALAKAYPDTPFVLRPHPFERDEPYGPLLADHDNVSLAREGTVDGLVQRACCLVERTGSTAIEATLGGVPVLSPHWSTVEVNFISEVDTTLDPAQDVEELTAKLGQVLSGAYEPPPGHREKVDAVVEALFLRIDGRSHLRVADAVEDAMARSGEGTRKSQAGLRARGAATKILRRREIDAWESSPKFFDTGTIRDIVDSVQGLDLPDHPHLQAPVELSVPSTLLGKLDRFKARSVLMASG